ncbi:MAG TPA: DUF3142 domain-containing protein [Planctomycetota bacterium]|nr:DUF3142 domain-containing protein [Planctomycetota bacterium]
MKGAGVAGWLSGCLAALASVRGRGRGRGARLAFWGIVTAAAAVGLFVVLVSSPAPAAGGAMPQEAYVWQRSWRPAVREALARAAPRMDGFTCLAAEVQIRNGRPTAIRVLPDWPALAAAGRPVGLALRIGPYRGPFAEGDALADFLAGQAAELLREARAGGVQPAELQVDFDCAESDLDGYRRWVQAIRERVAPVPVTVTALPCWLKHRSFARLAAEAGGYVLQVHSLERPRSPEADAVLCDADSARRAVESAGRIGVPFRVALPTYGYVMAFDRGGRFLGVSAEGPMAAWGPDVRLRELRADPAAMAGLVRDWTESRPACMTGLIWYRLPVESDVLNWRWPTLAAAMAGRAPVASLKAELGRPEKGLVEVVLANAGEADGPPGAVVQVRWSAGELLAADAIGGFDLSGRNASSATFSSPTGAARWRLAPGQSRAIGWLRFAGEPEVKADVAR